MKKTYVFFSVLVIIFLSWIPAQSEDDLRKDLNDTIMYYYVKPAPDKVPLVLEKLLSSQFLKTEEAFRENDIYNMAYPFGRIAQLEPALIKKYEDLFDGASHEGRVFILKILQICGNEEVKQFLNNKLKDTKFLKENKNILSVLREGIPIKIDPLSKEPKDAKDLDLLWAEFMITGNEEAVKKIINVLEWPDCIYNKLSVYLKGPASTSDKEKIVALLNNEYGIKCNVSEQEIENKNDLDIVVATNLREKKSASFQLIKNVLSLNTEEIINMANKGSAFWSLGSNAQQHEKVFEICDKEIMAHSEKANINLLQIVSAIYFSKGNKEIAIERLKTLLTLAPNDINAHYSLGLAYNELGNIEDASKELNAIQKTDVNLANDLDKEIRYKKLKLLSIDNFIENENAEAPDKSINKIIEAISSVKSYQSRLIMRDYSNEKLKSKNYVFVEWRFGYEQPEIFSVEQYANEDGNPLYDMWSSAEGVHYNLLPALGWVKDTNAESIKNINKLNYDLSIKKYAKLMQQNKPNASSLYEDPKNGAGYYAFKYDPPESGWDFYTYDIKNPQYKVEIWVDKNNLLPVKAFIKMTYKDKDSGKEVAFDFKQLFTNYNNTAVQAPLKTWNEKKQEFMTPEEFQAVVGKW